MRRLFRAVAVLAIASPAALLSGSTAGAAPGTATAAAVGTTHPGLLQDAWFWQTAYEQANPPVAAPTTPPTEPSGVPKGDLAVAHTSNDGSSSKMTVLAFDLGALKPGTTVDNFVFSIGLDSGSQAANVAASQATLVACLPTRIWSPADGGDPTQEPPVDCSNDVAGTMKKNTFTFRITGIADSWVDQNLGVAIVNDPKNTSTPYQVVFDPKTVKTTMDTVAPVPVGTGSSGGRTGSGSTGTGSGPTASSTQPQPQPPTSSAVGVVSLPPAAQMRTPPTPAQQPQVATDTTSTQPAATVAAVRAAPSAPPTAFWLGALALALLVLAAAVVLGDPRVPVPNATTTRLGRVLAAREAARSPSDATQLLAVRRA